MGMESLTGDDKTLRRTVTQKGTGRTAPKQKSENIQITFSHEKKTKKMLDELVWLKQFVIDMEELSQGDVVRQGLELLAKEIGYEKLRKKYADKLDNYKPKVGRKSR